MVYATVVRKRNHQFNIVLYCFFSQNFSLLKRNIWNNKPCKKVNMSTVHKHIHKANVDKDHTFFKELSNTKKHQVKILNIACNNIC